MQVEKGKKSWGHHLTPCIEPHLKADSSWSFQLYESINSLLLEPVWIGFSVTYNWKSLRLQIPMCLKEISDLDVWIQLWRAIAKPNTLEGVMVHQAFEFFIQPMGQSIPCYGKNGNNKIILRGCFRNSVIEYVRKYLTQWPPHFVVSVNVQQEVPEMWALIWKYTCNSYQNYFHKHFKWQVKRVCWN